MGGTRLEVFKFGVYLLIPISAMYVYNRPDLAALVVSRASLYPPRDTLARPPANVQDARDAFERLRAEHASASASSSRSSAP